jgi:hypothetical protein
MAYEDRIMRMAGSVPQRTVRPTMRDVAGPGGGPPSNIGYDRMGGMPARPPSNIGRDRMGGIFGGQMASGANDMVNAMMGGMDTSRLQRENEQAGISPTDWRRMWKLQQMGIDPTPHIDAVKYGPNPFPGPLDGGLPPTSPGPFYPGGLGEGWDQAERSSDFESDWRGQQMLFDRIIQANPGLGEDELMILFQQAMDQATS